MAASLGSSVPVICDSVMSNAKLPGMFYPVPLDAAPTAAAGALPVSAVRTRR